METNDTHVDTTTPAPAAEDTQRYSKLLKGLLAIAAVAIVIAVFVGGYQGLETMLSFGSSSSAPVASPKGTLLLSVVTVSTTTGQTNGIVPLIVDAANSKAVYMPVDQMASGPTATLQVNVASDASSATFLGTPLSTSTDAYRTPLVYRANLAGLSSYSDILHALQTAAIAAAPSASDYFRESPVVSPKQLILYSSISQAQFENASTSYGTLPAEDWTIYSVDANGNKQELTKGLQPKWIDNDRFAYFKNDGIYIYNIQTKKETNVWPLTFTPTLVNGLDVSDDGQFLAVTNPSTGDVSIIRALNWDSGLLSDYADIPVTATSPVFSPDDSYLAMFVLNSDQNNASSSVASIRYYSLANQQFIDKTVSFNPATIGGLYLTDWR